jgi:CheY-like chemotaxis protein
MRDLADPPTSAARCEALPARPAVRMSIGDPPGGGDDDLFAATPEFSAPRRSPLPRILHGVRILVVDDDPDTTDLFATALSACGADVVTTLGAREALSMLAARALDAVVTDIAMPGADGYWLVREIRGLADARVRDLPVVAVTAFGREHSRARALAAGFVDHLVKPVEPAALCVAVARALGRSGRPS